MKDLATLLRPASAGRVDLPDLGALRSPDPGLPDLSALTTAGVPHEIEVYAGASHGFAVSDHPVYDAAACERHWTKLFALFATHPPLIKRIQSELSATLVVVEHDLPLILAITDHVYCLEAGRVIAHGEPEEMRANPLVIASYLGTDERATMRSNPALAD